MLMTPTSPTVATYGDEAEGGAESARFLNSCAAIQGTRIPDCVRPPKRRSDRDPVKTMPTSLEPPGGDRSLQGADHFSI